MNFIQSYEKSKRVLNSCYTEKQLEIAKKYCFRILKRYGEHSYSIGIPEGKWRDLYFYIKNFKLN